MTTTTAEAKPYDQAEMDTAAAISKALAGGDYSTADVLIRNATRRELCCALAAMTAVTHHQAKRHADTMQELADQAKQHADTARKGADAAERAANNMELLAAATVALNAAARVIESAERTGTAEMQNYVAKMQEYLAKSDAFEAARETQQ